ncbi:MAG: 2,3-bisphosphoglycerate-dependent phosphoglycerate mutase [Deltaproteobacteria bacterium]|nr:2,3-bisphosphoglycerate-dependent phosphoglycerate mutase [Deltaproteobacteria bacterium]
MAVLVLMRHGESIWNRDNRFAGSVDVPLTEAGRAAAVAAATSFSGFEFAAAYCSPLIRARETAELFLKARGSAAPLISESCLVERNYGILQGLSKERVKELYGAEIYNLWHRSYNIAPPGGESLEALGLRVQPFVRQVVGEDLRLGGNVLLVAHGNVLRSLVMMIEKLDAEKIEQVELGTAQPLLYELDKDFVLLGKKF